MRPPFYSKLLHLPLELLLTINTYDLNFPILCIPNFPLSYSILPYWCSLPQTYWTHSFLWVGHSLCSQSLNSLPLDIGPWLPPPYSHFASTSTSLSGISGQTNTLTVLKLYTSLTLFFFFTFRLQLLLLDIMVLYWFNVCLFAVTWKQERWKQLLASFSTAFLVLTGCVEHWIASMRVYWETGYMK